LINQNRQQIEFMYMWGNNDEKELIREREYLFAIILKELVT
jgi:hypothetical protein